MDAKLDRGDPKADTRQRDRGQREGAWNRRAALPTGRAPAGQGPEAGGQDTHVSGFDWEIWGNIKLQCK